MHEQELAFRLELLRPLKRNGIARVATGMAARSNQPITEMGFGLLGLICAAGALAVQATDGESANVSDALLGAQVSIHSNDVYLDNAGSVAYTLTDYSISSGQPWEGVTSSYNSITVEAGRHGTETPAQFFLQDLGPANVMGNNVNSHQFPHDLNFAIKGDLTMNVDSIMVTCQNVRFGQGHNDRNNWWVGGPNCAGGNSGGNPVTCACNDGALITFQTGDVNRFSVSLENKCAIISERGGSWMAVTAAPGQKIGYSFSSSSTEYTETDFMASLSAQFSPVFEFGSLEMSAEASYEYITQNTDSSSWSKTCEVTVPEGQRLWQWTYTVETNCGTNAVHSCYFFTLPIDVGQPCCLAGFQSSVYNQCTEPGKNMCDGESADVEASSQENVTGPRRLRGSGGA